MNEAQATPHAELIAELMNPNNPKNEREYAAVREIERLQEALAKPVLQDIEQYRMQMAGICTAAIGYWKEGDGIYPDYDTLALQDVAKLYSKYDELYKAQPVPHAVIAGALFDFMGGLTSRKERLVLSGANEAGPAVEAITAFSKMRGLSLDDARVQDWHTTPPAALAQAAERNKVAAWMIAQGYATGHGETMEGLLKELERKASFDRAEIWIKRINEAVLAEREACAKVCDDNATDLSEGDWDSACNNCACHIRARGQS